MNILALWKTHYSIGRSTISLEKYGTTKPNNPVSLIDLAVNNNLEKVVLVEDGFGGFLEAYTNLAEKKIQLIFGIRLTLTQDANDKSEESLKKNSKIVILARNKDGYQKLIKIYTKAATDGFYYEPRIDYKTLKQLWDNKSLVLAIPFYDSFLFNNALTMSLCIPDFSFTTPIFFEEENDLPFDFLVSNRIKEYAKNKYEIFNAQSIFYEKREDFKSYLTFRAINNRTTLSKPNLNGMSSDGFCFENFLEKSKL